MSTGADRWGTGSAAWHRWFRIQYRIIRWLDPLVRAWWSRVGLGDTVELTAPGRRTGRSRSVLVGLLEVGGRWYVGHPNGPVAWTRNLEAAATAIVRWPDGRTAGVAAVALGPGPERSAAIRATFVQHPFPGNATYRLAGRHIEAVGAFYRLEPSGTSAAPPGSGDGGHERPGDRPVEPNAPDPAPGPSRPGLGAPADRDDLPTSRRFQARWPRVPQDVGEGGQPRRRGSATRDRGARPMAVRRSRARHGLPGLMCPTPRRQRLTDR